MREITLLNLLFFLAGVGAAAIVGAILLASRDIRRLSTSEPSSDEPREPVIVSEVLPAAEQQPAAVPVTALWLTTGLHPALADLHEPEAPQLPMHEWWLEQTAPYQLVDEPPREPIPDPEVLTGRQRWANGPTVVVRPNGRSLLSPLTPDNAALRVCDLVLAGAA